MSSKRLLVEEIKKMALGPSGDAPAPAAPKVGPAAGIGPGSGTLSTPKVPHVAAGGDVRAMQNLLLNLVHSGFIPPTGLPDAKFANGAWGPKTNASLKATVSATQTLLKLINELRGEGVRIDADSYSAKSLDAFQSWIPELKGGRADLSPEDQSKYAQELEKHLKSIKALNNQFMNQVGSKGEFRGLLNGEPIEQYSTPHQMTTNKETEDEVTRILGNPTMYGNVPVNIPGIAKSMPLIALTSKDKYLEWANSLYANRHDKPTEEQLISLFQRVIKPQLDKPARVS